jgi:hypothetical protein
MLVTYFGILAVARLAMGILTTFLTSPRIAANIEFELIPNTIGTIFGVWLHPLGGAEFQKIYM